MVLSRKTRWKSQEKERRCRARLQGQWCKCALQRSAVSVPITPLLLVLRIGSSAWGGSFGKLALQVCFSFCSFRFWRFVNYDSRGQKLHCKYKHFVVDGKGASLALSVKRPGKLLRNLRSVVTSTMFIVKKGTQFLVSKSKINNTVYCFIVYFSAHLYSNWFIYSQLVSS